jgi:purine-binding chemotaxis protein CheW
MIDWQAVKERLARSAAELEQASTVDPDRLAQIYRVRAEQLAARRSEEPRAAATRQVLVFSLAGEHYAFELACLTEVLPFARVAPVPGGPAALLGLINVRGELCSVVDLAQTLGLPPRETAAGYVVMLRHAGLETGVRVDDVEKIAALDPATLLPLDEAATGLPARYVQGVTADRLMLLRAETVLADVFSDAVPE